jgi:hypothetical protein
MNINPPMTMATSASDRASGPVNVNSKLLAALSQGDACANAMAGDRTTAVIATAMLGHFEMWQVAKRLLLFRVFGLEIDSVATIDFGSVRNTR